MAERKRIQTGAKRNAGPSAKTFDRGSVRTRRSLVVGSIVSAAVVAAGIVACIIVWPLNRVPDTRQETPATAGRPALAHVTESLVPPPEGSVSPPERPAPRAAVEALEKEALDAVRQLIKAMPKSSDPLALMGVAHLSFGNTAEAMQWWERCLKMNSRRPDVYDGMAQVAEAKGEYEKAIELWRKVLQINPRLPDIRNKLAGVLIDSGKLNEAIAVLEEELEVAPEQRSSPLILLGKAYLQLREYAKAQEFYEAAVEIEPDHRGAWYGLATAHARLGHSEEARRFMERFQKVRAADRDADIRHKRSRRGRGRDLVRVRRLAAHVHTSVGITYHSKGYLRRAEPYWKRAAELDPKDSTCRVQLAKLYLNGGKFEKALPICEQLVKIDPANTMFRVNLGVLYAETNRIDAALAEIQRAIDLKPDNAAYRRIYQQIQEKKQRDRQN